jgi:hypothetical protein
MISKRTIPETADKLNYKYGFLPAFAKNKNYGYFTDKENIENICPMFLWNAHQKELCHIDIDKLSDKKDDNEPICFVFQTKHGGIQAFIISKKDKKEFIKAVARAYHENREDIGCIDVELALGNNEIRYTSLCVDIDSIQSGPHLTFWQAIDSLAKDMPAYRVEMEMLEPCHVEIHLCRIGENEWARYLISIYEKED